MTKDISALMDGELDENGLKPLLNQLKQQAVYRQTWQTYHVIGDALRETLPTFPDIGPKIAERLTGEPTVLAPRKLTLKRAPLAAISAAASVAAVAFVGWMALQANVGNVNDALVTSNYGFLRNVAVERKQASIPAHVNPYLIAHQEFSPSTSMHGIGPYLRTVSEVEQGSPR